MMSALLAIDQSTSATKAVCFDAQGAVLARASAAHRQFYPAAGWVEHDAEEIWRNVLKVVAEIHATRPDLTRDLACVGLSNQRETVVIFERGTGRPLHHAIVWQCRRGDALCAGQRAAGREGAVRERTGLRIDGYFSASKLQWLVRERPELAARLADGTALIGTIDTYLIYRLTAGQVFATDHTNASRTLLYDIHKLAWDEELCRWWQVPRRALAEVRSSDAQFGATDFAALLPRPVRICGVMGDSQAALFAQRCFGVGSGKITLGTGSSVLLNVGPAPPAALSGALASLAWVRGGTPTYAAEGLINYAAATLNWLRDQLGVFADLADCEALAAEVASEPGVYLVPAFSGLSAPYWQSSARAAIVGLSAHSDRRHIIRAALEAIAYQLRDVLDMLRSETGIAPTQLRCDGAPTVNRLLMQFIADLLDIDLKVADNSDGSALGVALMGALGVGVHASLTALDKLPLPSLNYRRTMSATEAQLRYQGWQQAVQQVLHRH
jgi:glycerol kinase